MKYIIAMFGDQNTMMETRVAGVDPGHDRLHGRPWIKEIRDAGEFVDGQGLVDPSEAKTVRLQDGVPVATDGPYAEAKESLAGWWIVEADEARAIDLASRCVAFTGEPVEVRQVADAPPEV